MYYIEIAEGTVKNRGIIIKKEELSDRINKSREANQELYYSVWDYTSKIKEHFKLMKSVASYKGSRRLEYTIFDIDKGNDTDDFVLRRAQEFVRRLKQDYDVRAEELRIFYSGSGYHIYMPNYFKFEESEVIVNEVKQTMKEYFEETDLSIYSPTGIIRAPYSLNKKTGRYKIPLEPKELFGLSSAEIIELAELNDYRSIEPVEEEERDFSNLIVKAVVEREALNYREEPTRIVTCMQHLFNKGGTSGTRHQEGMRLISAWRRMGVPKEGIFTMMRQWAPSLESYEMEKMVNNIFDKGYRYGCQDIVMSKYCDPKCVYYLHKNYTANIAMAEDLDNMLADYSINMPHKKHIELQNMFNLRKSYRIYEGEMVILWGDTKLGKSALAQNILVHASNFRWLYLPLENGRLLDIRRLLQVKLGMTKEEVYEYYKFNRGLVREHFSNLKIIDTSLNLEDLRKVITSNEVEAVVVDTADQILTPKITDYTSKTEHLAIGFRDLCRDTKTILIIVHHISKRAGEDSDGRRKTLTLHSGKGSSAMEQKADKVISIEGNRDDDIRLIRSLGARDESPFKITAMFDKETFQLNVI